MFIDQFISNIIYSFIIRPQDVRRDLEINNIYANRALKAGRSSTRASALSSPAPSRHKNHERKNSEPSGMTPRDKAKAFEAQRRDQERQNREVCVCNMVGGQWVAVRRGVGTVGSGKAGCGALVCMLVGSVVPRSHVGHTGV